MTACSMTSFEWCVCSSAGDHIGVRRRAERRPRQPSDRRGDGAGSVQGGRRSECVSRIRSRPGCGPGLRAKDYARAPVRARTRRCSNRAMSKFRRATYDPVLGASYVQISREGLGFQKSQNGGGSIPKAGQVMSRLSPLRVDSPVPQGRRRSFFDGIDTSLAGIATFAKCAADDGFLTAGLGKINAAVEDALPNSLRRKPETYGSRAGGRLEGRRMALLEQVDESNLARGLRNTTCATSSRSSGCSSTMRLAEALGLSLSATVAPESGTESRLCDVYGRSGDDARRDSRTDVRGESAVGESELHAGHLEEAERGII